MAKAKLAAVLVALCLMLTACGTPTTPELPLAPPLPVTTTYAINIDQLGTYPPMPDGVFSYVEAGEVGSRIHYTLTAELADIAYTGKSGTLTSTPQSIALLFTDGSGLVLLSRYEPSITSGWVALDYSTPPGIAAGEPTAVLIHSIKEVK